MVFKYGPPEPHFPPSGVLLTGSLVIKYGPPEPESQIVDKYAPIKPNQPGVKPKVPRDEEVRAILKQIADCLMSIKKLLGKTEVKTIAEELGLCIAELSLLYLKLNDLQKKK